MIVLLVEGEGPDAVLVPGAFDRVVLWRDAAGKPVAIDYSNPIVRHIKFTRLADRQP